jgi:cytochrome P450
VTTSEIFQPLSTEMLNYPHPVYARLRSEEPVHWHETLSAWVVTSYADCLAILRDPDIFRSDFRAIGDRVPEEFLSLQTLDPPTHKDVRKLIRRGLRAVDVSAWAQETQAVAEKLLSELDLDRVDFVTEFAEPLAALSMCSLFGIPLLKDAEAFRSAQRDLVLSMDSGLDPTRLEAGMRARRELSKLIEPWIDGPPPNGLLSRIDFAAAGDLLGYLVNSLRAIFVAGYSSTSSMLGNAMRVLEGADLLNRDEPLAVTATAFNELVRYEGAVQAESRAVYADATLPSGAVLRRGDVVVTVVAAANRDPASFAEPDRLDLGRAPNPHLGFGRGNHACVGTRLALAVGVTTLSALSADHRIVSAGDPVQRPTGTLRGLDSLPLTLIPR